MAIAEPNFLANGNDDDTKKKIKKANIKWVVKLFYFLYFTNFKTGRRYTNQKPEAKKSLISTIYMSFFFQFDQNMGKRIKDLKVSIHIFQGRNNGYYSNAIYFHHNCREYYKLLIFYFRFRNILSELSLLKTLKIPTA